MTRLTSVLKAGELERSLLLIDALPRRGRPRHKLVLTRRGQTLQHLVCFSLIYKVFEPKGTFFWDYTALILQNLAAVSIIKVHTTKDRPRGAALLFFFLNMLFTNMYIWCETAVHILRWLKKTEKGKERRLHCSPVTTTAGLNVPLSTAGEALWDLSAHMKRLWPIKPAGFLVY